MAWANSGSYGTVMPGGGAAIQLQQGAVGSRDDWDIDGGGGGRRLGTSIIAAGLLVGGLK